MLPIRASPFPVQSLARELRRDIAVGVQDVTVPRKAAQTGHVSTTMAADAR